jgi:hypothetical protein
LKIRKILGRICTGPKLIFETFCTEEAPRCIGMNATLTTFFLNLENQIKDFSYTLFSVKNINVGKFENYEKIVV